jgi:two-component system, chemotaxis family, response regulator Rcp1
LDEHHHPHFIFVVDENDDDSLILYHDLEEYSMEKGLHVFASEKDLIDFCQRLQQRNHPCLILIDGFIKHETIGRVVSTIKSVPDLRSVPILIMIGAKYEKEYFRPFFLDVSGYVVKPINIRLLNRYLRLHCLMDSNNYR